MLVGLHLTALSICVCVACILSTSFMHHVNLWQVFSTMKMDVMGLFVVKTDHFISSHPAVE